MTLRGLYVVTDAELIGDKRLLPAVEAALNGGAILVQYRDKGNDHARRYREASALCALCAQARVPLIINDDIKLAAEVGAQGVHLGQQDASLTLAREQLGAEAIIGLSCYNNPQTAGAEQADYAAFGRFFASRTKPQASPADIQVLSEARRHLKIPIVAIGGIKQENALPLIQAGADMIAVVAGVFDQPDIQSAAQSLANLFIPDRNQG